MNEKEIDVILDEITESMLKDEESYYQPDNPFKSAKQIREEEKIRLRTLLETTKTLRDQVGRAFQLVRDHGALILSEEENELIQKELDKISDEKLDNPPPAIEELIRSESDVIIPYQHFFEITDEGMNCLIKVAQFYYLGEQYQEAIDVLIFVNTLNPLIPEVCFSLGLCYQSLEKWNEALVFFKLATELNPDYLEAHELVIANAKKLDETELVDFHSKEIDRINKKSSEVNILK